MSVSENIKAVLADIPGAVRRQGESLFVKAPLYKSKHRYTPVYINRALFTKLFSCAAEPSWQEMSSALEEFFSTTIEQENGEGEPVGTAYVDYQADPLALSLSGNLGSGRAYYTGSVFNIKGEKTPLAKSTLKKFSDGLLEMERCVWETLVANALQGSMGTGLSDVLAILDMNENCTVGWRDQPVRRGKIIRVDDAGELDRVTHLFYNKKSLPEKDWQECARAFGRLEGNKFVERIIHGTWSPGNISPKGHLIDFDTVSAVKGRSPQFSSTRWYHENYFGFEQFGQLNVIRAMTKDPHLNPGGVNFEALKKTMLAAMQEQISLGFITLMGFSERERIYARFKAEIDSLAELWVELARKGYKKHEEFSSKNPLSPALHAFDFSAFFRIYPMLKRHGLFSPPDAVALMTGGSSAWDDPFEAVDDASFSDIEQKHLKDVYAVLGEHFVTNEDALQMLQIAALGFVKKYDALHEKILHDSGADIQEVEARAYVINEDRYYMFPAYTASYVIAENSAGIQPEHISSIIETLIAANRRVIADHQPPPYIADIKLYKEGYSYTLLEGEGKHRLCFSFYGNIMTDIDYMKIKNYKLKADKKNKAVFTTREIDNQRLCIEFHREMSLHIKRIGIASASGVTLLKNILEI